jgi:hypothetical protein
MPNIFFRFASRSKFFLKFLDLLIVVYNHARHISYIIQLVQTQQRIQANVSFLLLGSRLRTKTGRTNTSSKNEGERAQVQQYCSIKAYYLLTQAIL